MVRAVTAEPKRWHAGRPDRVDHLFGAAAILFSLYFITNPLGAKVGKDVNSVAFGERHLLSPHRTGNTHLLSPTLRRLSSRENGRHSPPTFHRPSQCERPQDRETLVLSKRENGNTCRHLSPTETFHRRSLCVSTACQTERETTRHQLSTALHCLAERTGTLAASVPPPFIAVPLPCGALTAARAPTGAGQACIFALLGCVVFYLSLVEDRGDC